MRFPRNLALGVIGIFICFSTFASGATRLSSDEVEALKEIAKTLGKTDWSFGSDSDPCSWTRPILEEGFKNNVTCSCNIPNTTACHIVSISLTGQNLTGTLPAEFANLTHLQVIDLSRNYINGSIPTTFAKLPLTNLSILGNRISGSIPKEIGDIATLEELVLEENLLGGSLPQNLGSLTRLTRL